MTINVIRKTLSYGICASILGAINTFSLPPAAAQVSLSQCDQIQDRVHRQRCRSAVYDAQRYDEEARGWREEEARIRRDGDRACRRVGMVARFVGQGRTFRSVCEAPRRIYDSRH